MKSVADAGRSGYFQARNPRRGIWLKRVVGDMI